MYTHLPDFIVSLNCYFIINTVTHFLLFVFGLIATFVQVIQLWMIFQPVTEKLRLTPGSVALIGM